MGEVVFMKVCRSTLVRRALLAALAALSFGTGSAASAADAAVPAMWVAKKLNFTYLGFTARYSCDGLLDKVRKILLDLGARQDLKVAATGCDRGFGTPSRFPGVSGTVYALVPLGDKAPPTDTQPVNAQWQSVEIAPRGDPLSAAGDCELTEQIKQRILPLFSTRNVEYSSTCIPYQLQIGGTRLKAEVLVPTPPAAQAP
jgi:hypothetical protein